MPCPSSLQRKALHKGLWQEIWGDLSQGAGLETGKETRKRERPVVCIRKLATSKGISRILPGPPEQAVRCVTELCASAKRYEAFISGVWLPLIKMALPGLTLLNFKLQVAEVFPWEEHI